MFFSFLDLKSMVAVYHRQLGPVNGKMHKILP